MDTGEGEVKKGEYRHQCRYCAYCVFTMDSCWWCDELNKYIGSPKKGNMCDTFLFNKIPADNMEKIYRPRKPKNTTQLRFDFG